MNTTVEEALNDPKIRNKLNKVRWIYKDGFDPYEYGLKVGNRFYCQNLQRNMLTTYMNVNFHNIFETSNFPQSYAQYLYSIHIVINRYSKAGAALVNTI